MKWAQLSPFFAPSEIFSADTVNHTYLVDRVFLFVLNVARYDLDKELTCNKPGEDQRGVVSANELLSSSNRVSLSMHVQGKATDLSSKNATPEELATHMRKYGLFVLRYKTFIHADGRAIPWAFYGLYVEFCDYIQDNPSCDLIDFLEIKKQKNRCSITKISY